VLKERGFDPLVLVDTTNSGAVPIDKFVRSAAKCAFAIALFTPDDFVGAGKAGIRQARPNVLFELGWFYGRFGPSRTPIVKQTKTAIPSDLAGILSRDFIENVSEVMDGVAN
jgi:predicted nucleotide-binding protein